MLKKENINKDFWKVISSHYEKECYEDVLKDACLYIIELIQEKSENYDLDGEKLICNVFSEKNPKLLINKNQTTSEIDEQRGFGYIIRGLICAIRNPLSHKMNIKYTKETVDSIIEFINYYIIPKLDDTKEFGYVDNWFDFIFVDNEDDSEKYSNKILDSLNKKDRIKLMQEIIEKLSQIETGKYSYFINLLHNSLTLKTKNEIIVSLNRNLIKAGDDKYLRSFFDHFDPSIWDKLDGLITVRIEDIVTESIKLGEISYSPIEGGERVIRGAALSTWTCNWLKHFSNYAEIQNILLNKLYVKSEAKYVYKYFDKIIATEEFLLDNSKKILEGLSAGSYYFKKLIDEVDGAKDMRVFKDSYEFVKDLSEPSDVDDDFLN